MICPFQSTDNTLSTCLEDECALWIDNGCVCYSVAQSLKKISDACSYTGVQVKIDSITTVKECPYD